MRHGMIAVAAGALALWGSQIQASPIDPQGPDYLDIGTDGLYLSAPNGPCFTLGANTDCLDNIIVGATSGVTDSYASGPEQDSFAGAMTGELFTNGVDQGAFEMDGLVQLQDDRTAADDWLVPYDSQITEMDLMAGTWVDPALDGLVELRIDPIEVGTGETTFSPAGGGTFSITSFFDVFTDLSLDGGNTWIQAPSASEFDLAAPEPGSAALMLLAVAGLAALRKRMRHA